VVHTAPRRLAVGEGRLERGECQLGIDAAAERPADHPARPGVQDHGQKDEAAQDADVGQVGDPQLVRAGRRQVLGEIGEDRPVVVAVRGHDEPPLGPHAQVLLAHDPADPLVVDPLPFGLQLRRDPAVAVPRELGADLPDAQD
jgi:hypothetical protein